MNLKFSIKPQATKPSIQTFNLHHQGIFGSVLGKNLSWKMYPSPQRDLAKVANETMTVMVYHVLLQCLVNMLHPSLHPEGDPLPLHIQQQHLYHSCQGVTPCSSRQFLPSVHWQGCMTDRDIDKRKWRLGLRAPF